MKWLPPPREPNCTFHFGECDRSTPGSDAPGYPRSGRPIASAPPGAARDSSSRSRGAVKGKRVVRVL